MKARDLIIHLQSTIPRYTNYFSDTLAITSLTFDAGVVTCTTDEKHGLVSGDSIYINGALTPLSISNITRDGNIATATTNSAHDLTDNYTTVVNIIGADQTEYNGIHNFIHQPNRYTFLFEVEGDPDTPATGEIFLLANIKYSSYNGLITVATIIDEYTFTYAIGTIPHGDAQGTITLQKANRISGAVSLDRIIESYTKHPIDKLWLFVVLGSVAASKDRFTNTDGVSTYLYGQDFRQLVIEPFSIFIAVPTSTQLSAMDARDLMEDIQPILLKSVLRFNSASPYDDKTRFGITYAGHSAIIAEYAYAYYIHEFKFENNYYITFADTLDTDDSVAFRDINFLFKNKFEQTIMQTNTNLDDEPIYND
jgi:hypothetical protein